LAQINRKWQAIVNTYGTVRYTWISSNSTASSDGSRSG